MQISIGFFQEEDRLTCLIEDNGIGIETSRRQKREASFVHHSVGIDNVRQRIVVLNEKYDLQSSLTLEDKSQLPPYTETGTIVTIRLLVKNFV